MKLAIIYSALLLNKVGTEINQKNMTDVLKAADAPYDIETVIKVVDGLQGVDIKEVLTRGIIIPEVEVEEEPEVEVEEEEGPTGLMKLFG